MDKNKKCSVCNIKLDKNKYKRDRKVCKSWYNRKKRENNDNISQNNQKPQMLITIKIIIEPQTSNEFQEVLEPRIP